MKQPAEAKPKAGRPRLLRQAYRLNLYVEADFAADLRRLARHLGRVTGHPFSVSQVIATVVRGSREYRAMKREGGKRVAQKTA